MSKRKFKVGQTCIINCPLTPYWHGVLVKYVGISGSDNIKVESTQDVVDPKDGFVWKKGATTYWDERHIEPFEQINTKIGQLY